MSSKVSFSYGDKIALFQSRTPAGGFINSTNNSQFPVCVSALNERQRVPHNFENCIFQILCGDGDIKNCLTFNKGLPILYGQPVRLLHVKTFSLLCCNKKNKAFKEKTNFKVSLEGLSDEAKGNRWRVMPKYKVRGEGERLCGDDEVVFQLQGYQLFLHTCSLPFEVSDGDKKVTTLMLEINCTLLQEGPGVGYVLHAFDTTRTTSTKSNLLISSGECIILFHKQENGPLTAGRKPNGVVYVNVKPMSPNLNTKSAFTSTSLFITEFEDALRGGVLMLGKSKMYRLKSLATGDYLCVTQRPEDPVISQQVTPRFANPGGSANEIHVPVAQAEITRDSNVGYLYDGYGLGSPATDGASILESLCLSLVQDPNNPGTLFSMHQTTDDPDQQLRTHTRILLECPQMGLDGVWITSGKQVVNTRQSVSKIMAPLHDIAITNQSMQRDAFEVRCVGKDVYQQLYFVLGLLPSLDMYSQSFQNGLPTEQIVNSARDSLIQLIKYCSLSSESNPMERDGIPIINNQKMLIDQNVPERLMHILQSTFNPRNIVVLSPDVLLTTGFIPKAQGIRYSDIRDVCKLCLRLIRLCCKENVFGGVQMLDHMNEIMAMLNYGLGVAHTLQGLCEGNDTLVDTPDDYHLVDFIIQQCISYPFTPRFLTLLQAMCVCKERGIVNNQMRAIASLSSNPHLFLSFSMKDGDVNIKSPINPHTNEMTSYSESLWTFCELTHTESRHPREETLQDISPKPRGSKTDDFIQQKKEAMRDNVHYVTKASMQQFFIQQMLLLSSVAHGRNTAAVPALASMFPEDALIHIVLNSTVRKLRWDVLNAALRLLHHGYVNAEPFRATEKEVIVKMWGRLDSDLSTTKVEPMPPKFAPILKFVIDFLARNPSLGYRSTDESLNTLTTEVINLAYTMVSFKWLSIDDTYGLLNAIVQILRHSNDHIPQTVDGAPFVYHDRFSFTEHSRLLMKCKEKAVSLMSLIFDLNCVRCSNDFLLAFEKTQAPPHLSQIYDPDPNTKVHTLSEERLQAKDANVLMAGFGALKDAARFTGGMVGGMANLGKGLIGVGLSQVGLDGLIGAEVKVNPYQYLIDMHDALLSCVMYKFEPLSVAALRLLLRVFNYPVEVNNMLRRVQLLFNEKSIAFFKSAFTVYEQLKCLTRGRIGISESIEVTDLISQMCDMLTPGADLRERQSMFFNLGLPTTVIKIIKTVSFRNTPKQRPLRGLLEMSYKLLAQICSANINISAHCFLSNEIFLRDLEFDLGVIELLVVILDESIELCNMIPESLLRQVILIMTERDCLPLYVLFMRKIIWIDGKPVPHVQEILWKLITEKHMGSDTANGKLLQIHDVWTRERGIAHRNDLLSKREYENPDGKLSFHLQWMSLLFAVVKGKDTRLKRELSSFAFQASGVSECMEVVTNTRLPIFFRAPYLKILHEVFIDDKSMAPNLLEDTASILSLMNVMNNDIRIFIATINSCAPCTTTDISTVLQARVLMDNSQAVDATDVEIHLFYIMRIVVPFVRHFTLNMIPNMTAFEESTGVVSPSRGLNFQKALFQKFGEHAKLLMELMAIDKKNGQQHADVYAIPQLSPSRRIAGNHSNTVIFPSEAEAASHQLTDKCVFRLVPEDRKNMKNLLSEFSTRGVVPSGTSNIPHEVASGNIEDAVSRLQKELTDNPTMRQQAAGNKEGADDKIFVRWNAFMKAHIDTKFLIEDNRYTSFALYLLKQGRYSEKCIKSIVVLLRSPEMADDMRSEVFRALQCLFKAVDLSLDDDIWVLHPPEDVPYSIMEAEGPYKNMIHCSHEERQSIINRISELAAIIVDFTGKPDGVAQDALKIGIEFLHGGNKEVQGSMFQFCIDRTDEEFFQTNRNRLVSYQAIMKEKKQAIKRITGKKQDADSPLPDDIVQKVSALFNLESVERALRFIQLLCEGHNGNLQDYLRMQRDNQISVDVVEACASLLFAVLRAHVDRIVHSVCMQNIATLTELVQGPCMGNQSRLINANIGECINLALKSNWADLTPEENWELKEKTAEFLLGLVEGKLSISLAVELVQSLNLEALAIAMDSSHEKWKEKNGKGGNSSRGGLLLKGGRQLLKGVEAMADITKSLIDPNAGKSDDSEVKLGCYCFIFFKYMIDIVGRTSNLLPGVSAEDYWLGIKDREHRTVKETLRDHPSYKFFNGLVGSIEIVRLGQIEKVYFRVPEAAKHNLRKASQVQLLHQVDRDSLTIKLNDFFDKAQDLIFEIKFFEELSKTRGLAVIHEYYPYFDNVSIVLSILINLFLLFTVDVAYYTDNKENIMPGRAHEFYYVCGYIIVAVQCCLTLHFIFGSMRIHIEYSWRAWEQSLRDDAVKESKANMALDPPTFVDDAKGKLMWPEFILRTLFMISQHWPFWQRVLFMVAAVLGTEVHPFFFSLQLMQCIQKSPQLQNVVMAVTKNGKNLLLTVMLMLIFVYMFAIIGYYNFSGAMTNGKIGDGFGCDSLLSCFNSYTTYGLRSGGGIADTISGPLWSSEMLPGRILFDMLFFIILVVIFMNIVFGIIIDTFAELRETRKTMELNQTGTCFMCGIDKATLDRKAVLSGGFDSHVDYDHNMWQYVYYMHYLTMLEVDSLNGQEFYVFQMMRRRDISFFPINRALILREDEEALSNAEGGNNDEPQLSQVMDLLKERFDEIQGLFKQPAGLPGRMILTPDHDGQNRRVSVQPL